MNPQTDPFHSEKHDGPPALPGDFTAFGILLGAQFLDRLTYYGMRSILVLFMIEKLGFTSEATFAYYGIFTALTYISVLIGGIIADQWLGRRLAMVAGAAACGAGYLLLMVPGPAWLEYGLGLAALGTGLFKSAHAAYLGSTLPSSGFTLLGGYVSNYMAINFGALFASLGLAALATAAGAYVVFALVAVLALGNAGMLQYLRREGLLPPDPGQRTLIRRGPSEFASLAASVMVPLVALFLLAMRNVREEWISTDTMTQILSAIFFYGAVAYAIWRSFASRHLIAVPVIVLLGIASMFWWSAYEVQSMPLAEGIRLRSGLSVTLSHLVNPITLLVSGLLFATWAFRRKGGKLIQAGFGMLALAVTGAALTYVLIYLLLGSSGGGIFLILAATLLSLAELLIAPVLMTLVYRLADPATRATMFGIYFFGFGIANFISMSLNRGDYSNPSILRPTQLAMLGAALLLGMAYAVWRTTARRLP